MSTQPRRKIVFVLGMHRSGTSLTTHMLSALGVALSEDLIAGNAFNEKGYFESARISQIHETILRSFGLSWATSRTRFPLPDRWWQSPQVAAARSELIDIVQRELEYRSIWGFKDPRTARLLPLWNDIVAELDLEPKYVLVHRDARDCARSLHARERMSPLQSELLWLEHTADAVSHAPRKLDAIVGYEEWIGNGAVQAEYVIERLGLRHPGSERLAEILSSVIAPDLRHHRSADEAFLLPFTAEFTEALRSRDFARLELLTNLFGASRLFAERIVAHATGELIERTNYVTRIANDQAREIADLKARAGYQVPRAEA